MIGSSYQILNASSGSIAALEQYGALLLSGPGGGKTTTARNLGSFFGVHPLQKASTRHGRFDEVAAGEIEIVSQATFSERAREGAFFYARMKPNHCVGYTKGVLEEHLLAKKRFSMTTHGPMAGAMLLSGIRMPIISLNVPREMMIARAIHRGDRSTDLDIDAIAAAVDKAFAWASIVERMAASTKAPFFRMPADHPAEAVAADIFAVLQELDSSNDIAGRHAQPRRNVSGDRIRATAN